MLSLTNVIVGRTRPDTYTPGDATLQGGGDPYTLLWSPTARTADVGSIAGFGTKYLQASRSSTTCFMRGLREAIEVQTTTSLPWQWRRIVFTMKGLNNFLEPTSGKFFLSNLTNFGYRRTVNELYGTNLFTVQSIIFQGLINQDWDDPVTAKVDTTRVTLLYDKTRTIATGNQNGMIRRYKFWHAFNKNLVYNDDEAGGTEDSAPYSTLSKQGMGDAFIMDFFRPLGGSASTDRLTFRPNATLYWHEK